ncbi:hypothetical protein [Kitasatospora purpeofusca]|uniref:hypothetical protein n=1 Tax=Kitasatospora purpeofusca TaxID=67352 RepID=UPI0036482635
MVAFVVGQAAAGRPSAIWCMLLPPPGAAARVDREGCKAVRLRGLRHRRSEQPGDVLDDADGLWSTLGWSGPGQY